MPIAKVCRLQAIQELLKKNEELQKEIEEKQKVIATIKAAIAANKAELEKLRKENKADFVQEEPEVKKKECGDSGVSGSSRLRSSTVSMFGADEKNKTDTNPTEKKLSGMSKRRGSESE